MKDQFNDYYERATSWALDERVSLRRVLAQTRLFAAMAFLIAVLEAFSLMLLTPLKTTQTVPILVDRQTGFIEVLQPDGHRRIRGDLALTQSLLAQYVTAREEFDITALSRDYREVSLWSAGPARQAYLAAMQPSSLDNPLKRLPRSAIVDVQIKSISPLGSQSALVRFRTERRDEAGADVTNRDWAAVVRYGYSDAAMTAEDRLTNPLGFQVSRYHKDPETLPPPEAGPPASASVIASTPPPSLAASATATPPSAYNPLPASSAPPAAFPPSKGPTTFPRRRP